MTIEAEEGGQVDAGPKPRSRGGLQKLEKATKQSVPWTFQQERSCADTFIFGPVRSILDF